MRHLIGIFLIAACAHQIDQADREGTALGSVHPSRLIVVAVADPSPAVLEQPALKELRSEGLYFPTAPIGHLYRTPYTDLATAQSGLFPKRLLAADYLRRNTAGFAFARDLRLMPKADSLQKVFEKPVYLVSHLPYANAWGLQKAIKRRNIASAMLEADRWNALFVLLSASDSAALQSLLNSLKKDHLFAQSLIVLFGISAQEPVIKVGIPNPNLFAPIPSDAIAAYIDGEILRIWLKDRSRFNLAAMATKAQQIPGAFDVFSRELTGQSSHYIRTYRKELLTEAERSIAQLKHQELVETVAQDGAADLLILRSPANATYPILLWASNLKKTEEPRQGPRLVDLPSVITRIMGLRDLKDTDGNPSSIDGLLVD